MTSQPQNSSKSVGSFQSLSLPHSLLLSPPLSSSPFGLFLWCKSYFILTADKQMSELKLKGKQRQAAASGKLGESAQQKQQKQTRWHPHYAQFSSCHTNLLLLLPLLIRLLHPHTHAHFSTDFLPAFPHSHWFGLVCALPFFLQLFLYFSHSVKFSKCHFAVISWIIRLQLR